MAPLQFMPHKAGSLICGCKGNILFWFLQIFQQLSFKKAKKRQITWTFHPIFLPLHEVLE
nr:hypothetical protein [uncultured Prevotella sp.]